MSELQAKTMAYLRRGGFLVASVEHRKTFPEKGAIPCGRCGAIKQIGIAADLWNVFDVFGIRPLVPGGSDVIFAQVTSGAHHADRRNKIIASPEAYLCCLAGATILLQSWDKVSGVWESREELITKPKFVFGLPETMAEYYDYQERQKLLKRKSRLPDLPEGSSLPFTADAF